jgi:hypothetical protein
MSKFVRACMRGPDERACMSVERESVAARERSVMRVDDRMWFNGLTRKYDRSPSLRAREVRCSENTNQMFIHSSIHPFIHSSIHPFIHSSIHPFIHSSIHPFIHSSIHPFIHSSFHPFIHSSIHPFIHSSINFARDKRSATFAETSAPTKHSPEKQRISKLRKT